MNSKFNLVRENAEATLELYEDLKRAWREVDKYRLEAAKYKAYFFHKEELVEKLDRQLGVNYASLCGYSGNYMNLEEMYACEIITKDEYDFCNL